MKIARAYMKPYIQPFERILALRELEALSRSSASPLGNDGVTYAVRTSASAETLAASLSYWEAVDDGTTRFVTKQTLREATVNVVRNGVAIDSLKEQLPFKSDPPLPNRRCLRYGSHGIHEYRGKFFPQLVRSLINMSGIARGAIVADPMSGSGTTVVESVLAGMRGKGLDMNPLSVYVAGVKTRLLCAQPGRISTNYEAIRNRLLATHQRRRSRLPYFESLSKADQAYLSVWFSEEVLGGLDEIALAIEDISYTPARDLMNVALSNILRRVSWQNEDDLRVRRDIRLDVEVDPKKEFLEELGRSVRAVFAFLRQEGHQKLPDFELREGDARKCGYEWGPNSVDAVITSPPYATALPYLDTDRLSLCYLKLLERRDHRDRDLEMIGNREVSAGLRTDYWSHFEEHGKQLPKSVRNLITGIARRNSKAEVGFRRRNLPALLSKYFFDMSAVISGIHTALKPNGFAYMVVGSNHTIAGGQRVEIQTPELLNDVAKDVGLSPLKSISMEMLTSRDIFRKNAGATEKILVLQK